MILLRQHAYNLYSELRHTGGRAHRDESGTEAVEWIAIGASLFMLAAVLSVVMDMNSAQLGRSLTGQVENVVGKWGSSHSAAPVDSAQDQVDVNSIETVSSAQENAAAAGGGRSAQNAAASFSESTNDASTTEELTSDASSAGDSTTSSAEETAAENSGPEGAAALSSQGNLIVDGSQARQSGGLSIHVEETEPIQSSSGPAQEIWSQIEAHVRPMSDAVNRTFASLFREE